MKRLLIMRHAKSSWKDSQLADFDRSLNKRGRRDAPRVARALVAAGESPDIVISSSAVRARKTAALLMKEAGLNCPLDLTESLYGAPVAAYLGRLREVPVEFHRVLMIGHNPTLEQLLFSLTGQSIVMPTAAVARLNVHVREWCEVDSLSPADLIGVIRPRELADDI